MSSPDIPRRDLQFQRGHVFGTDMIPLLEGQSCLNRPLHINLRWIPLNIETRGDELEGGAQVAGQGIPVNSAPKRTSTYPWPASIILSWLRKPAWASNAASTPWRAAAPGCVDFTMVPVLAVSPPVWEAAMPRAMRVWV